MGEKRTLGMAEFVDLSLPSHENLLLGFLWDEEVVFKCMLFNYFSGVSINCETQNRLIRVRPHRGVYNSDFRDVTNE